MSRAATDAAIALVKPTLLAALLDGRAPIGEVRKLCAGMASTDMYRWQLEIAIKLRDGKTREALELADAFKTDGEYPEGFDMLGLVPPPPVRTPFNHACSSTQSIPNPIPEPESKSENKIIGCEKDENGRTMNLPYRLRAKLKDLITDHKQYYTPAEMTKFSNMYGVSVPRLEMFFENRRKWLAKKLRAKNANELKRMTGKGDPEEHFDVMEEFSF